MQPIRHVDRSLAAPSGSRPTSSNRSSRKANISDLRAYYWAGPGWEAALKEARSLVESGTAIKAAAASVGWNEKELIEALKGEAHPILDQVSKPIMKKTGAEAAQEQGQGARPRPEEGAYESQTLYEIQMMTVREVAAAIRMPYERCYLALQRAGTKFQKAWSERPRGLLIKDRLPGCR